jgi:hypothetical protein
MGTDQHQAIQGHPYSHKHCVCGAGYCKTCLPNCPSCGRAS